MQGVRWVRWGSRFSERMYPLHGIAHVKKRYTILVGTRYHATWYNVPATWYSVPAGWNYVYPPLGICVPASRNLSTRYMVSEYLPVGIGVPAGWYSEYPLVGINTIIGIKEVEIKVRLNSIVRSGLKNGI